MSPHEYVAVSVIVAVLVRAMLYLKGFQDRQDIMIDLQWKTLEVLGKIADSPDLSRGFVAHSGRVLKPGNGRAASFPNGVQ